MENTACAGLGYWPEVLAAHREQREAKPKCSECQTGTWHGRFVKQSAVGMMIASDGFLYSKEHADKESGRFAIQNIKIVREVAMPSIDVKASLKVYAKAIGHPVKESEPVKKPKQKKLTRKKRKLKK